MLKKLGLIALSSLLVLPAISSAEDYSFIEYNDYYSPNTLTTEGGVVSNFVVGDCEYSDEKCEISIYDGEDFNITVQSSDCDYSEYDTYCSLNGINIPAGTYTVSINNYYPRNSVSFSIGSSSGGGSDTPENSDVLGSFGSGLSGLVDNLVSSFGGILPTLILYGLGICMFFVFRSVVKKLSVSVFGIGKSKSYDNSRLEREKARKEKLYRENEQQKDMYFSMYKKDL